MNNWRAPNGKEYQICFGNWAWARGEFGGNFIGVEWLSGHGFWYQPRWGLPFQGDFSDGCGWTCSGEGHCWTRCHTYLFAVSFESGGGKKSAPGRETLFWPDGRCSHHIRHFGNVGICKGSHGSAMWTGSRICGNLRGASCWGIRAVTQYGTPCRGSATASARTSWICL